MRKHQDTALNTAHPFGVSPSPASCHIVAVTSRNLKMFKERELADMAMLAIFIDAVHRAGDAYMVSLGIDREGVKHVLGLWRDAT